MAAWECCDIQGTRCQPAGPLPSTYSYLGLSLFHLHSLVTLMVQFWEKYINSIYIPCTFWICFPFQPHYPENKNIWDSHMENCFPTVSSTHSSTVFSTDKYFEEHTSCTVIVIKLPFKDLWLIHLICSNYTNSYNCVQDAVHQQSTITFIPFHYVYIDLTFRQIRISMPFGHYHERNSTLL